VNFTVEWEPEAWGELHQLWAVAADPAAVRAAAEEAERLLGDDPTGKGQHLSEGLWRLRVPPLVVHFAVDPDLQYVRITDIAQTA
jgi:hypothetical protein